MFDLYDVFIIFIVILIIYACYHIIILRERAYQAGLRYCEAKDLQLLDQNVALKAAWFKRDDNKMLRFWLSFNFEFSSTGIERYNGTIVILGGKVISITLPPYRLPDTEDAQ